MRKIDEFSKVLDLLGNDEKDKLLISANGLMKAQKVIRVKSSSKQKPEKQGKKLTID